MTVHGLLVFVSLISASLAAQHDVNTNAHWQYVYYPLNGTTIQFRVKTKNDAYIIFSEKVMPNNELDHSSSIMEVVLGGWSNSKSAIRKRRSETQRVAAQTPNILSAQEFRAFWIKLIGPAIMVGREHENVPFLIWTDPDPLKISHFGVATGLGATGEWKIEEQSYDFESPCNARDVLVARSPWDGKAVHIIQDACWRALTETSCNICRRPDILSELPPSVLDQTLVSLQAAASNVAEMKHRR